MASAQQLSFVSDLLTYVTLVSFHPRPIILLYVFCMLYISSHVRFGLQLQTAPEKPFIGPP